MQTTYEYQGRNPAIRLRGEVLLRGKPRTLPEGSEAAELAARHSAVKVRRAPDEAYDPGDPGDGDPGDGDPSVPDDGTGTEAGQPKAADVRAWARGQGIDVPTRGVLPADLIAAYRDAQ